MKPHGSRVFAYKRYTRSEAATAIPRVFGT